MTFPSALMPLSIEVRADLRATYDVTLQISDFTAAAAEWIIWI